MKRRTLLAVLVSILMCMCICMTSCDLSFLKELPELIGDTIGLPKSDEKVIIDSISEIDLGDILDDTEEQSLASIFNELKKSEAELKLNTKLNNSSTEVYLGIKDQIIQVQDEEFAIITDNNELVTFSDYGDGVFSVSVEELDFSNSIFDGMDSEMANTVKNMISRFEFPEMTEDDLVERDGYYMLTDDYIRRTAVYSIDLYIRSSNESVTEEDYNEAVRIACDMLEALNLKIGFAVDSRAISGMLISVRTTASDISAVIGETIDEGDDASIYIALELGFEKDTVGASEMNFISEITYSEGDINATASARTIFNSDGEPVGCEATVHAEITGASLNSEYYDYDDNLSNEVYYSVVGNITVDASIYADLSRIGIRNPANVISINGSAIGEALEYRVYTHDEDYNKVYLDPSKYDIDVDLNEHGYNYGLEFTLDTLDEKNLEFRATIDYADVIMGIKGNMYLSLDSCTMMNAPEVVQAARHNAQFASNVKELEEIGENIADQLCNDYWSSNSYLWYDSLTGLYVHVSSYGSVTVYTSAPNSDYVWVNYNRSTGSATVN